MCGTGVSCCKAVVGFEPTNHGFAIRSLSPLGYTAVDEAGYSHIDPIATLVDITTNISCASSRSHWTP